MSSVILMWGRFKRGVLITSKSASKIGSYPCPCTPILINRNFNSLHRDSIYQYSWAYFHLCVSHASGILLWCPCCTGRHWKVCPSVSGIRSISIEIPLFPMVTSLLLSCLHVMWTHSFCVYVQVPSRDPCRCTHIWCVYPCMKVCLSLIVSLLYSSIVCPSFLLCFRLLAIDSLCLCLLAFGPFDRLTFFASDNVSAFGALVFVMVLGYLNSVHRLTAFFAFHIKCLSVRFFVLSVFLYISTLSSYLIKSVHGCTHPSITYILICPFSNCLLHPNVCILQSFGLYLTCQLTYG